MEKMDRRGALKILGSAPLVAGAMLGEATAAQAHKHVRQAKAAAAKGTVFKPRFFTDHEYKTVRVLADMIIPKDEKSGSATQAGVPEFMDFIMMDDKLLTDRQTRQTAMRGGLAWLDLECERRFNKTFLDCTDAEKMKVLDDIAYPAKARKEMSHGVAFFNMFRDLTATGFWTSQMGMEDLQFIGNVFVSEWTGCPDEALKKLNVKYGD